MEKEENQNKTSIDQNQDKVKETGKPDEKLDAENKQETDKEPKEKINCTRLNQINYIQIYNLDNNNLKYNKKYLLFH